MNCNAIVTARQFGYPAERAWRSAVLAGFLFLAAACAWGLDFVDIKNLVANQVPESVIINMAQQQGGLGLTEVEADELRQVGASENLINALGLADSYVRADGGVTPASPSTPPTVQSAPPPATVSVPAAPAAPSGPAPGTPITPLEVTTSSAYPALYDKEGWLSISNRDWQPYFFLVNLEDKRMFISRNPNGGTVLNPGENVVLNIRKEGYKLYGDTGEKLEVKIRENLTTTLSLDPFGVVGNSGLTGVVNDRGKIRSEVLFAPYVPAPQIIVAPAPAPVIIEQPSPVVVVPPPPVRYYYGRPRYYYRYW